MDKAKIFKIITYLLGIILAYIIVYSTIAYGFYYFSKQSKDSQCDTDARMYFQSGWGSVKSSLNTHTLSYIYHYDKTSDACYMLVNYNFGSNPVLETYTFVDMNKKVQFLGTPQKLGSFMEDLFPNGNFDLEECYVMGKECASGDQFLANVYQYFGGNEIKK